MGQQRNWLDYERYAVYGLGRSGLAAARLLARRGKEVVASDIREREAFGDALETLPETVEIVTGRNEAADADVVVVSPGLKPRLEVFDELRERSIPAVSEVDVAFDAGEAPFVAITGTDGKTTTTSMCGEIVRADGRPHAVAGNIGTPLCDVVADVPADGLIVAEISAFQLWSSHHFRPDAAGFTNVAGDHLDYFSEWDEYVAAKHRLVRNAGAEDWAAFNAEDDIVWEWRERFPGKTIGYGFDPARLEGCDLKLWATDGAIRAEGWQGGEGEAELMDLEAFELPGRHNILNAMCAAGLALTRGISPETVGAGLANFEPLRHRVEPRGAVEGVSFINDSKATNVNAALAGLASIDGSFVAIVGGVDKHLELDEMAEVLADRAAGVVLIGEIADRMVRALGAADMPDARIRRAGSMDEAVERGFEMARDERVPLILSPACSSFDMFDSYKHRGDVFCECVEGLNGG